MKKTLSLLLAAAMTLSLLAGCGSKHNNDASQSAAGSGSASASQSQQGVEKTGVNFMALSGPTGVGAAYLMKYYSAETSPADCPVPLNSTVVADNKEVTDALVNGTADIAAVATNVAANLAAKTDGGIQVLAVNTLGVLYILEKGDSVQSMADLAGKTVYATGQGANPEYVLNYLLTQNGVDPSQVDIQWMTAQEVTAQMASGDSAICMLPVPAATALMMKDQSVRQALSLSDEWDKLGQGSLAMGCVVGRTQFNHHGPLRDPSRAAVGRKRRHRPWLLILSCDPLRRDRGQRSEGRRQDPEGVLSAYFHELPSVRRVAQRPAGNGAGLLLCAAELCAAGAGGRSVHPASRVDPGLCSDHAHSVVLRRGVGASRTGVRAGMTVPIIYGSNHFGGNKHETA